MKKDSQSEQLKKAMKIHEIVNSDKDDLVACKKDLMTRVAMEDGEAEEVAMSIRDMFLPKLLKSEGIGSCDMPADFIGKMTDEDDSFANDNGETEEFSNNNDEQDDETESPEFDASNDDSEVDDEIATIHITVPVDKIELVEQALEEALGGTDAKSEDQAMVHDTNNIGDNMDKKEIEARQELRRTILAAVAEDDEVQTISRTEGFEHSKSEQIREEDNHPTKKGDLTDPDFSTLDYAESKVPTIIGNLGLTESNEASKFDGAPEDRDEYSLDFDTFEVPSQGNDGLYTDQSIPSQGELPRKRTVASSLGDFDPETAEIVLAEALKTSGVEDEDLAKLTYAEALELFKAIRTAEKSSYFPDGKMKETNNMKNVDRKSVTEDALRDSAGEENDPEEDHKRTMAYSEAKEDKNAYAEMLKKLMKGASSDEEEEDGEKDAGTVDVEAPNAKIEVATKEASELYKARLKTAYAMSHKLALAEMLPVDQVDEYAEGLLSDNLSVTAMIRQTNLMLQSAAANAEKLSASNSMKAVKIASSGISFNPSLNSGSADLSGAYDIQNALRNLSWTGSRVGMEE